MIRDKRTGDSLQYAFIEFDNQKDCEQAYFKMQGVLIDDHRIHVDFSQSVRVDLPALAAHFFPLNDSLTMQSRFPNCLRAGEMPPSPSADSEAVSAVWQILKRNASTESLTILELMSVMIAMEWCLISARVAEVLVNLVGVVARALHETHTGIDAIMINPAVDPIVAVLGERILDETVIAIVTTVDAEMTVMIDDEWGMFSYHLGQHSKRNSQSIVHCTLS